MPSIVNKHGLSRDIPDPIKRQVRQSCGFGCVICGLALYHYEHVVPVFAEAKSHDPTCICLLCPNHHERVTKGLIEKSEVIGAMQLPKALQSGFSHDSEFATLRRPVQVFLGQVEFTDPEILLVLGEESLIWFTEEDGRLFFSGKFFDKNGNLILEIIKNEWRHSAGNWDVEQQGKKLTIRERAGIISIKATCHSSHAIYFDCLHMYINGNRFKSRKGEKITIATLSGAGFFDNDEIKMKGPLVFRADGGFEVTSPLMIRGGELRGSRL
jgi:hypothetical protein